MSWQAWWLEDPVSCRRCWAGPRASRGVGPRRPTSAGRPRGRALKPIIQRAPTFRLRVGSPPFGDHEHSAVCLSAVSCCGPSPVPCSVCCNFRSTYLGVVLRACVRVLVGSGLAQGCGSESVSNLAGHCFLFALARLRQDLACRDASRLLPGCVSAVVFCSLLSAHLVKTRGGRPVYLTPSIDTPGSSHVRVVEETGGAHSRGAVGAAPEGWRPGRSSS